MPNGHASEPMQMDKTTQSTEYLAKQDVHEEWERDYLNPEIDRYYDAAFAHIAKTMGAGPGDSILDAGCGYCYHAARFARLGLKVTGVDFSPAALAAARVNLQRQGLSIDLREGNLLSLPFPDASFPFVNCWGVLMHIPQLEVALGELVRVLQPGGRLALAENNRNSLHVRFWEPFVIFVKQLLGKKAPRRDIRPQGLEEWRDEGLMIRKIDVDWLKGFMAARGLRVVDHSTGQFSEIYTAMPGRFLKGLVYRFNEWWFRRRGSPALALGQILVFEKTR